MPRLLFASVDEISDVLDIFANTPVNIETKDIIPTMVAGVNKRIEVTLNHPANTLEYKNWYCAMGRAMMDYIDLRFDRNQFCLMLLQKHLLYGLEPLLRWKHIGILQRIDTKLARLQSILADPDRDLGGETLYDTCNDIIGYAVIGYLLREKEKV